MQYFQAVQEGKIRSNKAQMRLFEIAGFDTFLPIVHSMGDALKKATPGGE